METPFCMYISNLQMEIPYLLDDVLLWNVQRTFSCATFRIEAAGMGAWCWLRTLFLLPRNIHGGFLKQGYPQIIYFHRIFHYKQTIFGHLHLWKAPHLQVKPVHVFTVSSCLWGIFFRCSRIDCGVSLQDHSLADSFGQWYEVVSITNAAMLS